MVSCLIYLTEVLASNWQNWDWLRKSPQLAVLTSQGSYLCTRGGLGCWGEGRKPLFRSRGQPRVEGLLGLFEKRTEVFFGFYRASVYVYGIREGRLRGRTQHLVIRDLNHKARPQGFQGGFPPWPHREPRPNLLGSRSLLKCSLHYTSAFWCFSMSQMWNNSLTTLSSPPRS